MGVYIGPASVGLNHASKIAKMTSCVNLVIEHIITVNILCYKVHI